MYNRRNVYRERSSRPARWESFRNGASRFERTTVTRGDLQSPAVSSRALVASFGKVRRPMRKTKAGRIDVTAFMARRAEQSRDLHQKFVDEKMLCEEERGLLNTTPQYFNHGIDYEEREAEKKSLREVGQDYVITSGQNESMVRESHVVEGGTSNHALKISYKGGEFDDGIFNSENEVVAAQSLPYHRTDELSCIPSWIPYPDIQKEIVGESHESHLHEAPDVHKESEMNDRLRRRIVVSRGRIFGY